MGKRPRLSFAILNKNFLNFPLARDARTKVQARVGAKTGRQFAELDQVKFIFPKTCKPRYPTGFDVNVLLLLLAEARKQKSAVIVFASNCEMLRMLGLTESSAHIKKLKAALDFWRTALVVFEKYHVAGKPTNRRWERDAANNRPRYVADYRQPRKCKKTFPPVIKMFRRMYGGVRLGIDKLWLDEMTSKYVAKVYLPLPNNAAAQNAILALLAFSTNREPVRLRRFCRKIGLNHSTRTTVLRRVLEIAQVYFNKIGLSLTTTTDKGRLFTLLEESEFEPPKKPLERVRPITKPSIQTMIEHEPLARALLNQQPEVMIQVHDDDGNVSYVSKREFERDIAEAERRRGRTR